MNSPLQVPRMRAAARRVKAGGERFLGGVLAGATARRLQIRAFADEWAASNLDARQATGPLWIVLGDSISQGIGATTREASYVGVMHELLRRRDAWRVINLSRAEAGVLDVLARQLPELASITAKEPAALVTCLIGAEDLVRRTPGLDTALRQVVAALPVGSVIGTLPHGSRMAAQMNGVIREEAERHAMRLAVLPPRLTGPLRGRDARGLGDVGHAAWARSVLAAADGPPLVAAPPTDPNLPIVPPLDTSPPTDPNLPIVPPLEASADPAGETDELIRPAEVAAEVTADSAGRTDELVVPVADSAGTDVVDEGVVDEGVVDEGVVDEGVVDEGVVDEGVVEAEEGAGEADVDAVVEEPAVEPVAGEPADTAEDPVDAELSSGAVLPAADAPPADAPALASADAVSTTDISIADTTTDISVVDQAAGNEAAGNEAAGNEVAGNEAAGNEVAGNEVAGNGAAGNEPADEPAPEDVVVVDVVVEEPAPSDESPAETVELHDVPPDAATVVAFEEEVVATAAPGEDLDVEIEVTREPASDAVQDEVPLFGEPSEHHGNGSANGNGSGNGVPAHDPVQERAER